MNRITCFFMALLLCLVSFPALAQQPAGTNYQNFAAAFAAPYFTGVGSATITFTAGKIYNGGNQVSIVAGTVTTLGASKSSCTSAAMIAGTDSCAYIYWPNTGTTLLVTNTYGTAAAAGNVIVAFATTDSNSKALTIVPASLVLPSSNPPTPGGALTVGALVATTGTFSGTTAVTQTAASATPGTVRNLMGQITTFTSMTTGTLMGVSGRVLAGGNTSAGTYNYGTQGKAITGSNTIDSAEFTGLQGQLDVSGGTISSGHVSAIIGNIFGFNSGNSPVLNTLYLEAAGGGVINAQIQTFGKAAYWVDIQTNVYAPEANSTCTPGAVTGGTGGIHVLIDGVSRYIPLAATCS